MIVPRRVLQRAVRVDALPKKRPAGTVYLLPDGTIRGGGYPISELSARQYGGAPMIDTVLFDYKIQQMLTEGLKRSEIARRTGKTRKAVTRAIRRMRALGVL